MLRRPRLPYRRLFVEIRDVWCYGPVDLSWKGTGMVITVLCGAGLIRGDEIMVINGAIVSDLDMMYLESVLQEELALCLMMRSSRTEVSHPAAHRPKTNACVPSGIPSVQPPHPSMIMVVVLMLACSFHYVLHVHIDGVLSVLSALITVVTWSAISRVFSCGCQY